MSKVTKEQLLPAIDVLVRHAATYQRIGFERSATVEELEGYRSVVSSLRTAVSVLQAEANKAPSELDKKKV